MRPLKRARAIAAAMFALATWATPGVAQLPAPPVFGTGPLQVGAYGSLTLGRPEHPEEAEGLEVTELALGLLAWGQITPRTSYFVELDMATRSSETWTGRETNESFAPVRLYAEYSASDLLRFRAGRFLTPVGQWNERHAEPLTWTPTRPLTTYRPFSKSLNGILAAGSGTFRRRDVGYAVFWAPSWDPDGDLGEDEESTFVNALGARAAAEVAPGLTIGMSLARFRRSQPPEDDGPGLPASSSLVPGGGPWAAAEDEGASGERGEREEEDNRTLLGADIRWVTPRIELGAEGAWLSSHEGASDEKGVFLLGAVRLSGPLWGVARTEIYDSVDGETARTAFLGLTVRAGRHFVLKGGRQFSKQPSEKIPDGWFLSFSSLF